MYIESKKTTIWQKRERKNRSRDLYTRQIGKKKGVRKQKGGDEKEKEDMVIEREKTVEER